MGFLNINYRCISICYNILDGKSQTMFQLTIHCQTRLSVTSPSIILTSESNKIFICGGESHCFYLDLVEIQLAVLWLSGIIPDNDICFEAHVCDLPWCYEMATSGDTDAGDIVCVTRQKILLLAAQILNNNCVSQGINQVLAIWMDMKSFWYSTWNTQAFWGAISTNDK